MHGEPAEVIPRPEVTAYHPDKQGVCDQCGDRASRRVILDTASRLVCEDDNVCLPAVIDGVVSDYRDNCLLKAQLDELNKSETRFRRVLLSPQDATVCYACNRLATHKIIYGMGGLSTCSNTSCEERVFTALAAPCPNSTSTPNAR